MRKFFYCIMCILLSALLFSGCMQNSETNSQPDTALQDCWDTVEQAYIFTLPLMLVDATKAKMTNTVEPTSRQAPVNQLIHAEKLADANSKDVVTPNTDTVYSQVFLDLSQDAVILELPKTNRYCTAEILDAYTNCISILDAAQEEYTKYIFTGKDFHGEIPEGMKQIECTTDLNWIIIRTICYEQDDLENVHELQQKMDTYTLTQYKNHTTDQKPHGTYSDDNEYIPVTHIMQMTLSTYFSKANQLIKNNPPAAEDAEIMKTLKTINVGPEMTFDASLLGENADIKWKQMLNSENEKLKEKTSGFSTVNGCWNYWGKPIAEFGTEYDYRALVALAGLGANPISMAIYPKAETDSNGNVLNGNYNYVIHFNANTLPKTKEQGFWSITAYNNDDNLLIPNEINRYCINDRTDFTYNEDGSLDIYVQQEAPKGENANNWIPVGSEDFHLYMRIYKPDSSIIENQWKYPEIIKQN